MNFMLLTDRGGDPAIVNLDDVIMVLKSDDEGSLIVFRSSDDALIVKESVKNIHNALGVLIRR